MDDLSTNERQPNLCRQCRGDLMILNGAVRCTECGVPDDSSLVADLYQQEKDRLSKEQAQRLIRDYKVLMAEIEKITEPERPAVVKQDRKAKN